MDIGFIGLGLMGGPMCANLAKKSGRRVLAFDISGPARAEAAAQGAQPAQNAAEAGRCDVVFTMLPADAQVQAVYEELLPQVRAGQILVDMSSISPATSRVLAAHVAQRGGAMLDAPVVKSRPAAVAGTLGIYAGGPQDAFRRVLPLLRMMGSEVLHLGENGNGLVMKLCHNALVAQIQNGVNETMALAHRAAGIGPLLFARAIAMGGGQNFYLDGKAEFIARRDFAPAFSVENMNKDIHLAQNLAGEYGLPAPGIRLAAGRYEAAMAQGLAAQDFSATWLLQPPAEEAGG